MAYTAPGGIAKVLVQESRAARMVQLTVELAAMQGEAADQVKKAVVKRVRTYVVVSVAHEVDAHNFFSVRRKQVEARRACAFYIACQPRFSTIESAASKHTLVFSCTALRPKLSGI